MTFHERKCNLLINRAVFKVFLIFFFYFMVFIIMCAVQLLSPKYELEQLFRIRFVTSSPFLISSQRNHFVSEELYIDFPFFFTHHMAYFAELNTSKAFKGSSLQPHNSLHWGLTVCKPYNAEHRNVRFTRLSIEMTTDS